MSRFERINEWTRRSLVLKLIGVAILVLLLLIPANMVQSLVREREYTSQNVIDEVSSLWSNPQRIVGPILSVPYKEFYKNDKGEVLSNTRFAYFLPETLNIDGNLATQKRYRSIYEVIVYSANLTVEGTFNLPDLNEWKIDDSNILWDEIKFSVGLADMRGIKNIVQLTWNNQNLPFESGSAYEAQTTDTNNYTDDYSLKSSDNKGGIIADIPLDKAIGAYNFKLTLDLNGSRNMYFTPVGRTTTVNLTSDWSTPSFQGEFLPYERTFSENGFTAAWQVLHLNRNYPQQWLGKTYNLESAKFGVDLLIPVDYYQKSMRSVKYAILFISLTFLVFFFVEALNNKRIHPIQYILVGLALVLFFALLIAFSEHIGFNWAYLVSSVATTGLIAIYVSSVFKNGKLTLVTAAILAILYGFIYTLLQLESYALLIGTIGLFVILSTIMFYTRRIDWYGLYDDNKEEVI